MHGKRLQGRNSFSDIHGGGRRMKKKWIAFYAAGSEWDEFDTYEDAWKWLHEWHVGDAFGGDGYASETVDGADYIAQITHRSKYVVTDCKESYPCPHKVHPYCNGYDPALCPEDCPAENPWPYSTRYDNVGKVEMEKVEEE
jgi:hypothetical protein